MALIPDKAAFQNSLADLPLVTYQPGETVIADGSRTGRGLLRGGCPLMALSGHLNALRQCPLLGVKRTSTSANPMSAISEVAHCILPRRTTIHTKADVLAGGKDV